jgi:hypothetical protein
MTKALERLNKDIKLLNSLKTSGVFPKDAAIAKAGAQEAAVQTGATPLERHRIFI